MPTKTNIQKSDRIPPGQQLVAPGKWPVIGQREPIDSNRPWQISIAGRVENPITLTLDQLREQPQQSMTIDIHCVTRWSKLDANFSGVTLARLIELSSPLPSAKYVSFTSHTDNQHSSSLEIATAIEMNTLIAVDYQGQPLPQEHGGPIRCIVPGRYFYKSVKWVERIELLDDDQLGNWEAESGYHNLADPWLEQRYMAPSIDKRKAALLINSRDFSNQALRGIDCSKRSLENLNASRATLRNANFASAILTGANFRNASLANAHFPGAMLAGADFRDADVEGADFSGADLRGADFSGASLVGTSFFQPEKRTVTKDGRDAEEKSSAALIDDTTIIPEDDRSKLFPVQQAFVDQLINKPFGPG